ncbi:hypothetical protein [Actinoallomurus acaciae]|uniref:Secreted protein n=1 Tax=Actinoallomurus acaciae TaxID=502577 RepID=A0ABV5Y7I7_9ACTN
MSVALLAVIAAVLSFGHMRELALWHGEAHDNPPGPLTPRHCGHSGVHVRPACQQKGQARRMAALGAPLHRELGQSRC